MPAGPAVAAACYFLGESRSVDHVGVAVSRGCCVGLDVESTSRLTKSDPLQLARRRFSEREFTVLQGTSYLLRVALIVGCYNLVFEGSAAPRNDNSL